MLHAQLFNVNPTCHSIPLGSGGSSVTPAVPRPLPEAHLANRYRGLLLFGIGLVAVAYRGLLLFGIGLVERMGFSFVLILLLEVFRSLLRSLLLITVREGIFRKQLH